MFQRLRAGLASICASYRGAAGISIWLPAAVVLTFGTLETFDAFGIHEATSSRSEQVTLRIVSPFYTPSREVAVVLVDDDYLKARKVGWPLRFAEQGRLLRQIASAGPAVILVDFVYPHEHGDAEAAAASGAPKDDIDSLLNPILNATDDTIPHVPIVFTAIARSLEDIESIQAVQADAAKKAGKRPPQPFEFCAEHMPEESSRVNLRDEESIPAALGHRVLANSIAVGKFLFRGGIRPWPHDHRMQVLAGIGPWVDRSALPRVRLRLAEGAVRCEYRRWRIRVAAEHERICIAASRPANEPHPESPPAVRLKVLTERGRDGLFVAKIHPRALLGHLLRAELERLRRSLAGLFRSVSLHGLERLDVLE